MSYFCFDGESFEEFNTLKESADHAQGAIECAGDEADPDWPEWVENVCFGVVVDSVQRKEWTEEGKSMADYSIGEDILVDEMHGLGDGEGHYCRLTSDISALPRTWVPAVLVMVVEAAVDKGVFSSRDGMMHAIGRILDRKESR